MPLRLTARRQRFLEAYFGEARFNSSEAARIAGYRNARVLGSRLKQELAPIIENKLSELREASQMSASEVLDRLTLVARTIDHKDHVKALELIAKIHGQLSEKLQVNLDRKTLLNELDSELKRLQSEAETVRVKQPN